MIRVARLCSHLLRQGPRRGNSVVLKRASSSGSNVHSLYAAFKDPNSPYYLAPGTVGPASPDEPDPSAHRDIHMSSVVAEQHTTPSVDSNSASIQHATELLQGPCTYDVERRKLRSLSPEQAKDALVEMGYHPGSFLEQKIVWGDLDSFQHVNNVRYLRFLESSRILYMAALGRALGGPTKEQQMLKGKGTSLIMKSIELSFRRPVTYPDTLLVAHRPVSPPSLNGSIFQFHALAYSYTQQRLVLTSNCDCVWYDYDKLRKAEVGKDVWSVVKSGISSP
ncbi:Thioesterase/thiol ester dehydrase-isomerase [Gloeophyllum trabeum ATCC 11539]|uniref:Thioesterase/thiol ester dehydrase-isomerase n=1 Tax=Gloeophyllum trabeum (strain ATCC 11539 / FP-39264 / Madison 617) TaxID=670483 RepID=S7Q840_GLOTA|nr:Thioesterase/thiol ester dehydrase-isomerase [Gloeophyllum trabeum ATCC 11539]EPQ56151.1 Thioesterase/thiol ester dehydrase-isomerase [Gloeophyllum trabeum ATCC 11539]